MLKSHNRLWQPIGGGSLLGWQHGMATGYSSRSQDSTRRPVKTKMFRASHRTASYVTHFNLETLVCRCI